MRIARVHKVNSHPPHAMTVSSLQTCLLVGFIFIIVNLTLIYKSDKIEFTYKPQTPTKISPVCSTPYSNASKIVVLGMHRSGTSMITGLLATCLRIYTGGPLILSDEENKKGYFERADVVAFNQMVLLNYNLSPNGFSNSTVFTCNDFLYYPTSTYPIIFNHSVHYLVDELNKHKVWIIKDPRLCLTYGFYHKKIQDPIFIIPIRHPMQVAQSLYSRVIVSTRIDQLNDSLEIWYNYIMNSLRNTIGFRRIFVFQDNIIKDPETFIIQIHSQLKEFNTNLDDISHEELKQCAHTWIHPDLVHHNDHHSADHSDNKHQNDKHKGKTQVDMKNVTFIGDDIYTQLWNDLKNGEAQKWTLQDLPEQFRTSPYHCL